MIAGRIGNFLGKRISLPLLAGAARVIIGTCELLAISLVMQVGLAPPMAYYFHRATVVALRPGAGPRVCVAPIGEDPCSGRGRSARRDCRRRHRASVGWVTNCGCSCADAWDGRHCIGSLDCGPGNAFDPSPGDIGRLRASRIGLERILDLRWSGASGGPSRSAGSDDD
jgi:hypothetical protein